MEIILEIVLEFFAEFFGEMYVDWFSEKLNETRLKGWQRGLIIAVGLTVALGMLIMIIAGAAVVSERLALGLTLLSVGAVYYIAHTVAYVIYLKKKRRRIEALTAPAGQVEEKRVDVTVEENLKNILLYLDGIERMTGKKIHLVGATKTRTAEEINRAVASGLKIVGENRAQEFRDKRAFIDSRAEQHFIGHLQTNKIKYVVGKASLIHSCDSVTLAKAVDEYAGKIGVVQDMLIELNVGGEESKHGFAYEEAVEVAEQLKNLKNVRFRGVMTVLPKANESELKAYCQRSSELFERVKSVFGEDFIYLSMGMSGDYKVAIENGANMIRLGSAIFGERDYGNVTEK